MDLKGIFMSKRCAEYSQIGSDAEALGELLWKCRQGGMGAGVRGIEIIRSNEQLVCLGSIRLSNLGRLLSHHFPSKQHELIRWLFCFQLLICNSSQIYSVEQEASFNCDCLKLSRNQFPLVRK